MDVDLYMNCLIRQAKASNGDFDRGKSEHLKTKRIERSRKATSLSECTGQCSHTTLSGRDQGWCTKSEHLQICDETKRRGAGNSTLITAVCSDLAGDLASKTR